MTPGEEGEIPVSPPHLWPRIHVLAKAGFCPRGRPVRISIHQCAEQAGRGSLLPGKVDSELLERGGVGRAPQMNIFLRTSSRARPWSREAAPKEETTPAPQAQSQHPRAGNPTCSALGQLLGLPGCFLICKGRRERPRTQERLAFLEQQCHQAEAF